MSAPIHTTTDWKAGHYDMVIDVRSPSEFADDHIPGAVNLPAMSDEERAVVGTLYKQTSAFEARKTGAAIMSRNIARHIDTVLQDKPPGFRPLIHCWRGGQRSRAFALVLSEVGWTTHLLQGGYKAYRRDILDRLKDIPPSLNLQIIAGRTGSGKTALLQHLQQKGGQIVDLEDLAAHRGSLLGQIPGRPQPSQRLFESCLIDALLELDPDQPVFVESESSRIGNLQIPPVLWRQMTIAPLITLDVPVKARAAYLVSVYDRLTTDTSDLSRLISGMVRRHGYEVTGEWQKLMQEGNWCGLAEALLSTHYDPAYDQSVNRHNRTQRLQITQPECSAAEMQKSAVQILSSFDDQAPVSED